MEQDIWQLRLDKENEILEAYQNLYASQENDLVALQEGTTPYNQLVIQQLQLRDEIEAKKMGIERLKQDKQQQEMMLEQKALFAEKEGEAVVKKLREKVGSPLTKDPAEKAQYQALLRQANEAEQNTPQYNEIIFRIATVLGLIK